MALDSTMIDKNSSESIEENSLWCKDTSFHSIVLVAQTIMLRKGTTKLSLITQSEIRFAISLFAKIWDESCPRFSFLRSETPKADDASLSDDLYKCKSWLPGDTLDWAFQKQHLAGLGVPFFSLKNFLRNKAWYEYFAVKANKFRIRRHFVKLSVKNDTINLPVAFDRFDNSEFGFLISPENWNNSLENLPKCQA